MDNNCIFCKIVKKEIPKEIIFEDEDVLAFKDIKPIAPVHILIIPRRHIESVNDFKKEDQDLAGKMMLTARDLAQKLGIAEDGYKLLLRTGKNGGQEVAHIHLHLLGGAKLYEKIGPA